MTGTAVRTSHRLETVPTLSSSLTFHTLALAISHAHYVLYIISWRGGRLGSASAHIPVNDVRSRNGRTHTVRHLYIINNKSLHIAYSKTFIIKKKFVVPISLQILSKKHVAYHYHICILN